MNKVKVGILGATSYTGLELIKILSRHPSVEITFISSQSYASKQIAEIFPSLKGIFDDILISPQEAQSRSAECIFSCLPHAVSAGLLIPFIEKGIKIVDLSADFRIENTDTYKSWYKIDHPAPEYLKNAVYGLPEFYRGKIANASLIANPGCYVTSILLPLLPLFESQPEKVEMLIADSKSGVSGAGRSLKLNTHFVEANENFSAYSIGHTHRHTPEIEQELSKAAKRDISLTFSPHLLPINRGILSTIYIKTELSAEECYSIAANRYKNEPFVRLRDPSDLPAISNIAHTNFCDISFTGGQNGHPVIAVSTLDNLIKGASGQAVQNFNIMFGQPETNGLS
ncbi:N-acetyl-gamma-glutamyl-phosphate reductase [Chitinispirillum alkaliphilum]|nr:N-acetyl-gamma-glutamyl-phosphate reductase [Chitinispirillum alkaliphilum]